MGSALIKKLVTPGGRLRPAAKPAEKHALLCLTQIQQLPFKCASAELAAVF